MQNQLYNPLKHTAQPFSGFKVPGYFSVSPGRLRRAIARARLGTHVNKSRPVIDRTRREAQFFMKFY